MAASILTTLLQQNTTSFIPIGIYAGLGLTEYSLDECVKDGYKQAQVALAVQALLETPVLQTGMDLSVEAEAFGSRVQFSEQEIPTVIGRLVSSIEDVEALQVPQVGTMRTAEYLRAASLLVEAGAQSGLPVLGGVCGPFSLAGRLFGVSEALEASLLQPDLLHQLLEKTTLFLIEYTRAFKAAGCAGVILAEPAAGLLSPRGMKIFSSGYIRRINEAVQEEGFTLVKDAVQEEGFTLIKEAVQEEGFTLLNAAVQEEGFTLINEAVQEKGFTLIKEAVQEEGFTLIKEAVQEEGFTLIVHNCGAKAAHLEVLAEIGASVYHFGKPMDMEKALQFFPAEVAVGGNLDPSEVFLAGTAEEVEAQVRTTLTSFGCHRNYFLSSGCDVPPGTPIENLLRAKAITANLS